MTLSHSIKVCILMGCFFYIAADSIGLRSRSNLARAEADSNSTQECTCLPPDQCEQVTVVAKSRSRTASESRQRSRVSRSTCELTNVCCTKPVTQPTNPPPVAVSNTTVVGSCGVQYAQTKSKIYNPDGGPTKDGEYPWMAAVLSNDDKGTFLFGGSIIHPSAILTAAHRVRGKNKDELKIRVGRANLDGTGHQDRRVSKIITHEQYTNDNLRYDVAILHLESPIELSKAQSTGTVCIPYQDELPKIIDLINSKGCIAAGWGESKDNKMDRTLKQVTLGKIIPREQCQSTLNQNVAPGYSVDPTILCAGGEDGKDSCFGDGGGPLFCPINDELGTYYIQVGIVAGGFGCGRVDVPGLYADVCTFADWIQSNIPKGSPTNTNEKALRRHNAVEGYRPRHFKQRPIF